MGNGNPAVPQTPVCELGRRCHVSGKGINKWGTVFPRAKVRDIASSSVQLVVTESGEPPKRIASGTLISTTVVLCAAHTLSTISLKDVEIMMYFECDDKTSLPGAAHQYRPARRTEWRTCTTLSTTPQAKALPKPLEIGDGSDMDYALIGVEWKNTTPIGNTNAKIVTLPRIPILPNVSRTFSSEVLLVGHPWGEPFQGEPTQASAGKLRLQFGPHPESLRGVEYGYAGFEATTGHSGGGVFNDKGDIIGILKGTRNVFDTGTGAQGPCFLNIGAFTDQVIVTRDGLVRKPNRNSLLTRWLEQSIRPEASSDPIVFKT